MEENEYRWKDTEPQFEDPPAGAHVARCISVVDMGTQEVTWNNTKRYQRKVTLRFELVNTRMSGIYKPEMKGKPFTMSRRYTASLNKRAALRQDIEMWRGKAFTDQELEGFSPKVLLGQPCVLNIVEDDEYVNIKSITRPITGTTVPRPVNPLVYLTLVPGEFDEKVFSALPERTRQTIAATPEYKAMMKKLHPGEEPQQDAGEEIGDHPF